MRSEEKTLKSYMLSLYRAGYRGTFTLHLPPRTYFPLVGLLWDGRIGPGPRVTLYGKLTVILKIRN